MTSLSKIQTSPRALAIAIVALLVVLTAATWFILVSPKRNQSSSLSSQIKVAKSTLQARQATARHASSKVSQSLFIRRALPDTVAIPQVILELNRVASSDHVTLDGVTPSAATAYLGFNAIPISVVVSGRFFDIEAFLQDLRTQVDVNKQGAISSTGRLFDVQSVNLTIAQTAPQVSATIALNVFDYSGTTPDASTTSGAST